MWLYHKVKILNQEDGMANSADPDQTAPLGTFYHGRENKTKFILTITARHLRPSIFETCDLLWASHIEPDITAVIGHTVIVATGEVDQGTMWQFPRDTTVDHCNGISR